MKCDTLQLIARCKMLAVIA